MNYISCHKLKEDMEEFLKEVDSIKTDILHIRENIDSMTSITKSPSGNEKLSSIVDLTNSLCKDVKSKIYEIQKYKKDTHAQMWDNMYSFICLNFNDVMKLYVSTQETCKNYLRKNIEYQYKIVNPLATENEIESFLQSGNTDVYSQAILHADKREKTLQAYDYINDKHNDILLIERNINELHDLFLDMTLLVESQGTKLDSIQIYIGDAIENTSYGVEELKMVNKQQKKSRKKMCCIIIFLVICVIIVAVMGGVFGSMKK